MKLKDILTNLFFPPKCMICKRLLPIREDGGKYTGCLCDVCCKRWQTAKLESCPDCLCPSHMCVCAPAYGKLKKFKIPKLVIYEPEKHRVQNKIILRTKNKNDKRICQFLADELTVSLCRYLLEEKVNPSECIFTYVPRRNKSVGRYGFDQAKRLANYTAKFCEGEFCSLFVRLGGREQKRLDKNSRNKNIDTSIFLPESAEKIIRGRTVILIDDLITTGSTMGGAYAQLKAHGAGRVYVACVAKTVNKEK